jgi:hypothetical protein
MNMRACVLLNNKRKQHSLSGGLICSDKSGPFPPFVTVAACYWVSVSHTDMAMAGSLNI